MRFQLPRAMLEARRRAGISAALDANPQVTGHRFNPRGRALVVAHTPRIRVSAIRRLIASAPEADPVSSGARPGHPERHMRSLVALGAGGALALAGQPLALPLIGLGSLAIFRRAAMRMRKGKIGVDALDATAMTITAVTGQVLTAALIGALVEGGELLRDLTASRSRRELGALMSHEGATCWKVVAGRRVAVKVGTIHAGDRIAMGKGDRIPVDGLVTSGRAVIDERVLTGEPVPVTRARGDRVFAMTVVHDGELVIEATGTASESRAGRIMTFLERTPIGETRMADHARRIADGFVLPVMCVA
ncbi:MAG TPA: hypothetical protein VKE27_12165, partial [Candidatus Dormibacteraeota bacterium]|nr:hypothetical protein [Candidatus Dormibacteraeota bacterium]